MGKFNDHIKFLVIDLFCGAGGTTTGAEDSGVCKVIAAVNHDPLAISSHAANHADVLHMTEDIVVADIRPIVASVEYWKQIYPSARVILWASLECTNFSNAKGGLPRDADSRSLAQAMFRYLDAIQPDYFLIENVKEFMAWGDLDESGRPVSKLNGRDYIRWVKRIQTYGFRHDWRMLCAADYGGVTIRERYFGAFWKPGCHFAWPQRTHAKRPSKGEMFADEMRPWRAVAEVLDFSDLGASIFDRKRPLVDKTLRRILAGLKKFHATPQIMLCNSPGYCTSTDSPIPTLTTVNSKALVVPMLQSYYGNTQSCGSISEPAPTVRTHDSMALVTTWIDRNFRSGRSQPVTDPAGALLTVPKMNLCSAFLVPSSFNNSPRAVADPAPTLLASRRHINIASTWIVNPQYRNKGNAVTSPAPTVIAKQRSFPLSLASTTNDGPPRWTITDADSPAMVDLKDFMRAHGIADIFMRMLMVKELKLIQGFPADYVLHGPLNEQKKFIGNSVETGVVRAWLRAMAGVAQSESIHMENAALA